MRTITARLVDRRRKLRTQAGGYGPRVLTTVVRYPAPTGRGAQPRRYPLVVFGHGFALTPGPYGRLLRTWARAGYVVAAPSFPRTSAYAPGEPDESDLVNQPGDMRFVISQLLAAGRRPGSRLRGRIDPHRIAVAGHSDGGDTALAVAYDPRFRDRRVSAAVILAGAMTPESGPFAFPRRGPALLAVQGTADSVNRPSETATYYARAGRPKLRLSLYGAGHYSPYFSRQPQLRVVERVSLAFLARYLKRIPISPHRLAALGRFAGVSRLRLDL